MRTVAGGGGRGAAEVRKDSPPLLAVKGVSKLFGATQALDSVDMTVNAGEIVALLGDNGAGKSTLIKVLAGVHPLDRGAVFCKGADVSGNLRSLPIACIHQDLGLIDWMTVSENICLTLGYPRRLGMIDERLARRRAASALAELGVAIDPDTRIHSLTRTEKSLVAIARALASDMEILVLDEPTASLPANEVIRLFEALRRLRARGVGIVYVSHRLDEVFAIADRMVVLRDGRVAGERQVAETTPDETILLIVGREPGQVFRRPRQREGAPRLTLDDVRVEGVGPVSCEIRAGEIVGLAGLRDAGHERIGRALFGLVPGLSGTILLDGDRIRPASAKEAIALGLNLICADRVGESIVPRLTVRENLFLNPEAAGRPWFSYIMPKQERGAALRLGRETTLKPNDPELEIEMLSGGNQQKVVVGRWLNLRGKVYLFEEPTAGVDVGAKTEIYRLFDVALQSGAVIIIISTDFEEVAKICHRAMVFDRGRVVTELEGADLSVENLLAAASANINRAAPPVTWVAPAGRH